MARWCPNSHIDAMLQSIEDNSASIWVLSSGLVSMTYDNAKTFKMASATVASTIFTIADGDVSGRKTTVAAVSGISVTVSGTATHVALIASALASALVYLTEASSQVITAGNTMSTGAWDIEVRDPAAP